MSDEEGSPELAGSGTVGGPSSITELVSGRPVGSPPAGPGLVERPPRRRVPPSELPGARGPGWARPRVTILQRRLVAYRVGLFERLRTELDRAGIDLRVVYGQPSPADATRHDSGHLAWGDEVRSRWLRLGRTELLWQPCPPDARRCDLVVLTQESRILSNYPWQAARSLARLRGRPGRRLVAYWGHGRNLQSTNPNGLRERWKGGLLGQADWWFAYTGHTRNILEARGYPNERITELGNAIDAEAFATDLAAVDDATLAALGRSIDLAPGAPLGIYCGALYADKRVDLLAAVAIRIHAGDPRFRLVVIGDGPARGELEARLAGRPWARCVGAAHGVDKAAWFRLASVQLSPGAVGLHVLDSFTAGVPLVTTGTARHGPEIDYLVHDHNGLVLDDDPDLHAKAVVELLADPGHLARLRLGAREAAGRHTLDAMVANFTTGIERCLATGRPPR